MDNFTLSIIITTRNRANDLNNCISSILSSKFIDNFEIIIIDDSSEDDTSLYDDAYFIKKHGFENITIYHLKKKSMMVRARNIGIKLAKAQKYVLFIDDDNEIDPYMINKLINFANLNKSFGIIGPSMYYFDNKKKYLDYQRINLFTGKTKGIISKKAKDFYESDGIPNVFMIRTELFKKYGMFDERLIQTFTEPDFAFSLKKHGIKCCIIPDAVTFHKIQSWYDYRSLGGRYSQKAYCLMRNRFIIIKRYGNSFNKIVFLLFFSWLWPILYSSIIFARGEKYGLIGLYWKGFKDGVYYFLTSKFKISIKLDKLN